MPTKIGFHAGVPGNLHGIDQYMRTLALNGVPFCVKSVNDVGLAVTAAKIAKEFGVEANIILRWTNPGGGPEVPDYSLPPSLAAEKHWELVLESIMDAPEIVEHLNSIWLETINEPRTKRDDSNPNYFDMHPVDWLGEFASAVSYYAIRNGCKWLAFSMNAGEPEADDWHRPGMADFLSLAGENKSSIGIALHEYTFDIKSRMRDFSPHLIGRYSNLVSACSSMGIEIPNIFITELGWTYVESPEFNIAVDDITWLSSVLEQEPAVRAAYLWTLASGWGNLENEINRLMEPVISLALSSSPDGTPEPPPEIPPSGVPREQYSRVYWVVPSHASPSDVRSIYSEAAKEQITVGPSYDDAGIGALESKAAVLFGIAQEDRQTFIDWYNEHYPGTRVEFRRIPGSDPLSGLVLSAPFRVPFALTSPFNAERSYGLHEGADYDIIGGESDSKESVLACYPGRVIISGRSSGAYAERVAIESEYNGEIFVLWYAHMDSRYVDVGDRVVAGQPIGELGGTGGTWAEHIHINLQHDGTGLDGYVLPNVRDPHPFMTMSPSPEFVYTGPSVKFVAGIDQPASDWYWPSAARVFDRTRMHPKFHTTGNSVDWFNKYKSPIFNIVRAVISPSFANRDPSAIYSEIIGPIDRWVSAGVLDFILFNEPNIPSENLGKLWDNGEQFANTFIAVAGMIKARHKDIRIWFSPMSPGVAASPELKPQHKFIADARRALGACFGVTMHSYTGIINDADAAALEILNEIAVFQKMWAYDKPLVVGEFSVNRPAPPQYKAGVYERIYAGLNKMPGIQAAYSFTSSWYGGQPPGEWGTGWDINQEGWLESGIFEFINLESIGL